MTATLRRWTDPLPRGEIGSLAWAWLGLGCRRSQHISAFTISQSAHIPMSYSVLAEVAVNPSNLFVLQSFSQSTCARCCTLHLFAPVVGPVGSFGTESRARLGFLALSRWGRQSLETREPSILSWGEEREGASGVVGQEASYQISRMQPHSHASRPGFRLRKVHLTPTEGAIPSLLGRMLSLPIWCE